MSQTTQTQNKGSKKVATTTTGSSSAATLSSLVSKKKSAVPVLECKRDFKDDGNDDDEEKRSSEEEDTSDDCEDGGDGENLNDSSKKNKISSKFDQVEYAKLLAEIFPSKYSKNKALTIESSAKKTNGVKEQKVEKQKCENNTTATVVNSNPPVIKRMKNTETSKLQSAEAPSTAAEVKSSSSAASNSNVVGNYNIVINIKEPFEDLLEEDEYTSDMDDSVYDDESASSNDNSSDETYNDDDETSETDDDEDDDDTSSDQDDDDDSVTDADAEESKCEKYEEKDDTKTKYGFEKCKLTVRGKNIVGREKTSGCISSGKNKKPELLTSDKVNDHDYDSDGGWNTEDETTIQAIKAHMEDLLAMDKNNKIARTTLAQMIDKEKQIKEGRKARNRKVMRKNVRKFGRLLHKKNSANDLKYFKKHLSNDQQVSVLGELEELNKMMLVEKPYRLTLLESKIPKQYKAIALKRIQNLRYMDPGAGEYYKVKNWVDTFMTIPFGVNKTLPITMEVGVERCHDFMESAKDLLDSAVYGLNDAKMQIMQMVGQWISNPQAMGSAIAIKGPPGTGKTTLVKDGISQILGRDFAFIALGGATDSSFLEGHSYTYEGSTWGKIVDILIRCKSMNPVIFFDELDKLSDTPKGEEIAGILTHLTDTSQNSQFHDKYFSEIHFDLSKCLFIFSYNDETKVNPILLDRMYRIHTNGYTKKDKTQIAQKYLIPKIQTEVAFKPDQILIPDETIEYIVEHHTQKEDGVRNLKRCLEIIYTKLNLYRLMKPGTKLFDKDATTIEVSFPFTVTNRVVDIMIKKSESTYPTFMYT
jgi:ATP-dependent Lon protease